MFTIYMRLVSIANELVYCDDSSLILNLVTIYERAMEFACQLRVVYLFCVDATSLNSCIYITFGLFIVANFNKTHWLGEIYRDRHL